ncbi:hypothetical protein [Thiosocius teredinicola]|uniref:hypothetical protein n=1 Tax=Thiosocius teredinicola TaxID=1973002 RepID=UPI000F7A5E49
MKLFTRQRISWVISLPLMILAMTSAPLAAPITGDLLVQSQTPGAISYEVTEYLADGSALQTFVPVAAPASSDLWHPRDLVIADNGNVHVFNGTFDPYLSTYDSAADTWTHVTHTGWSTINNISYGGIATLGDRVFVTNMSTAGKSASGGVVFDTALGTSVGFASGIQAIDLNLGLDGNLWLLEGGIAYAYDPTGLNLLGSVSLAAAGGDVRALAVDGLGDFFVATWDGLVAHLASDGTLIDSLQLNDSLTDIDLSANGVLAIGSRSEGAWLSTTDLNAATQVASGRWNYFVALAPSEVPLPGTLVLLSLGIGMLVTPARSARRHRY